MQRGRRREREQRRNSAACARAKQGRRECELTTFPRVLLTVHRLHFVLDLFLLPPPSSLSFLLLLLLLFPLLSPLDPPTPSRGRANKMLRARLVLSREALFTFTRSAGRGRSRGHRAHEFIP